MATLIAHFGPSSRAETECSRGFTGGTTGASEVDSGGRGQRVVHGMNCSLRVEFTISGRGKIGF
jgi:hypothetical protein